jgi:hypothetical protein
MRCITGLALLTTVLSPVPVVWLNYSLAYLAVMVAGVHLPLLFTIIYLRHDIAPSRVSRCLALLKGSYFAGILALLLA